MGEPMTDQEAAALRAELRTILHRAGMFQLIEAVLARAITPEEYAAEIDRRDIVRTYPARVYAGTALVLMFAGATALLGALESWWAWGLVTAVAASVAVDVCVLVRDWREAKKPEVTP